MAIPANIGKYRIERRLGEGGMGTVYLAHDEGIDRHVAIKVLRADDEEMRRRFRGEARSVGRLKHAHIVTVYDYSDFEGSPCIVMEYVEGETLAALIKRGDPMGVPRKLQLIEQVCRGLAYAHRAGIVHRDIKPSNLMLDHDGAIKIVDFGIARTTERGLTMTGKVVGTLAYMAPEQIRGEPVDRRCDIFAVGLVLYEFLTGKIAFPGDSDYSIFNRIVTGDAEPFRHPDAALSELIVPVIDTALAKDPEKRYQDADQLANDLASVRARMEPRGKPTTTMVLPSKAPPMPLRVQEPATVQATVETRKAEAATVGSSVSPTVRVEPVARTKVLPAAAPLPARRSRWWMAAPVLATAALVLAGVYMPFGGTREQDEVPAPDATPATPTGGAATAPAANPPPTVAAPVVPPVTPTQLIPDRPPRPVPLNIDKPVENTAASFTARLTEASRLFEDGDYAGAASAYASILAEDARNLAATRGLGIVRRAQLAEQKVTRGTPGLAPLTGEQNSQVARQMTEAQQRQADGEYDAAIVAYEAALKIDPKNTTAAAGLAETRKAQAAEAAVLGGLRKKPGT